MRCGGAVKSLSGGGGGGGGGGWQQSNGDVGAIKNAALEGGGGRVRVGETQQSQRRSLSTSTSISNVQVLIENSMAFDLGIVGSRRTGMQLPDAAEADRAIAAVADKLKVVLINEYWDESMILLKRVMCWDLNDVLYVSMKSSSSSSSSRDPIRVLRSDAGNVAVVDPPDVAATDVHLANAIAAPLEQQQQQWRRRGEDMDAESRGKLQSLLSLDYRLYAHFNKTFWARIADEDSESFYAEVAELRRRVADLNLRCTAGQSATLVPKEALLCEQQRWENAKFSCELAKRTQQIPQNHVCKACVFRCSKTSRGV